MDTGAEAEGLFEADVDMGAEAEGSFEADVDADVEGLLFSAGLFPVLIVYRTISCGAEWRS